MNPFPDSWSSDRVANCLLAFFFVCMFVGAITVRTIRAHTQTLPVVQGGTNGEVLKIKPSLSLPNGEKP